MSLIRIRMLRSSLHQATQRAERAEDRAERAEGRAERAEALLREISTWRCGQEYEDSYDGIPCLRGGGNTAEWCAPCRARAHMKEHGGS